MFKHDVKNDNLCQITILFAIFLKIHVVSHHHIFIRFLECLVIQLGKQALAVISTGQFGIK
jgi:hypothetical protein